MNWAAAAVVLVMTTSASVADEARVLSDLELDAVTAAGVLVDVNSFAAAFGDRAHTLTDAKTFASRGAWFDLGVGLTLGHAFACCGEEAEVEVGSAVLGAGDLVHGGTHHVEHDNGRLASGFSLGVVVAASFKRRAGLDHAERLAILGDRNAVTGDVRNALRAPAPSATQSD